MKVLKKAITMLLVSACLFGTVACGGGGNSGQKDVYSDVIDWNSIDWEGKKDSSKDITVYISNDMKEYYKQVVEDFETANPQYHVNVIWGDAGTGVKTAQTTALSTGNPPDLVLGGDVHILNQRGLLLPLNKLIERDDAEVQYDDFLDELKEPLKSGEGIYYLPTSFNVSLLAYNKDLFDAAGLQYPTDSWTFSDFLTAAKTLTKMKNNMGVQWGNQNESSWWTQWYSILTSNGGQLFDSDGYVTLDNEIGRQSIQTWFELAGSQRDSSTWTNKVGTNGGSDGGALGGFAGGKVGMFYSIHTGQLMDYSKSNVNFEIAPLPLSDITGKREGTELSITAYGIHRSSANKKGAWEFLKWMTKARTDTAKIASFANPVPRKSERDLLLSIPSNERQTSYKNLECIYNGISYSKALPRFSYFEEVVQAYVVPELNKTLMGTATVNQAVKAAETTANSYIEYRYKSSF